MHKIDIHLHKNKYKEKPLKDIAEISTSITKEITSLTPQELAEFVGSNGQTAVLGIMSNGERKKSNFISQQVVMLDFDNSTDTKEKSTGNNYITINQLLNDEYITENASFIYKTFNFKDSWERIRVVFILDEPITSQEKLAELYKFLLNKYPQADKSCKDSTRIFFGGLESIEIAFTNVLRASNHIDDNLLPKYTKPLIQPVNSLRIGSTKDVLHKIRVKDIEGLREILGNEYQVKLSSKAQIVRYLKTINMFEFFRLTINPFYDFFHYENSPSASIFKLEDSDIYLYKCHSENFDYKGDLILVMTKLLKCSYSEALDFLIKITGIEINFTEKIKELREQCEITIELLLSEDLKSLYPNTNQIFWRYKTDIVALLNIFKENVYEDSNGDLRSLTWLSVRNLSYKIYGTPSKYAKISRILNLLVYTNWLDKLDENKIPKDLLNKLKEHQNNKKNEKRSNVFELLLLGGDFFQELNDHCEMLSDNGFTMKALSQEYIARTDGKEIANQIYVQEQDKRISKKSTKFATYLSQVALEEINNHGFIIEKDLLTKLKKKYSKSYSEVKYKQCISELMIGYNLERVRLTKKFKDEFKIEGMNPKSMPMILKQK